MNKPTAPLIEIDKIDVEDGFNVRTQMNPEALQDMAATYKRVGVIEPIVVREADEGRFLVTAGHRRLAAAKIAGLKEVPAILGSADPKTARLANLIENLYREDVNPIDFARGLRGLAEEFELKTNKAIAEEIGYSASWVGQQLALLKLPDDVQTYIAEGIVPADAERALRKVAEVSPAIAEHACALAKRRKVKPSDFVRTFVDLLFDAAHARAKGAPTMILTHGPLSSIVTDPKAFQALVNRRNAAVSKYEQSNNPYVSFGEPELDAARAAGCLLEMKGNGRAARTRFTCITDADLAADLAERWTTRTVETAAERAKGRADQRARAAGADPSSSPEEQKDQRAKRRSERQKAKEAAAKANDTLGRKLVKRRGGATRRQFDLAREKALAAVILADNPSLAARGLRLVLPQLQGVEVTTESGKTKKLDYADIGFCAEYLRDRIEEARSAGEVKELLTDTILAAIYADEGALPKSRRTHDSLRGSREVFRHLAEEVKSLRLGKPVDSWIR